MPEKVFLRTQFSKLRVCFIQHWFSNIGVRLVGRVVLGGGPPVPLQPVGCTLVVQAMFCDDRAIFETIVIGWRSAASQLNSAVPGRFSCLSLERAARTKVPLNNVGIWRLEDCWWDLMALIWPLIFAGPPKVRVHLDRLAWMKAKKIHGKLKRCLPASSASIHTSMWLHLVSIQLHLKSLKYV